MQTTPGFAGRKNSSVGPNNFVDPKDSWIFSFAGFPLRNDNDKDIHKDKYKYKGEDKDKDQMLKIPNTYYIFKR